MKSETPTDNQEATRGTVFPSWVIGLALLALAAGVVVFAAVAAGGGPGRAWRALLVGFLFWAGIAQAAVVWAALFRTTAARWTAAVARLGQAMVGFVLVSVVLLIVLSFGRAHFLLWLDEPLGARAAWLNVPFLFGRDTIGLLVLCALSLAYVALSVRADSMADGSDHANALERTQCRITQLSVAILIAYAVVYTVLAFDLIMSLDGHWFSTLLGAHYFVGNLYVGMAVLIVLAVALRRRLQVEEHIGRAQLADMGNLMMAFGMLTASFFFFQLLTIWYGNLPEETGFFTVRLQTAAWLPYGYVVLVLAYVGPFVMLVFRETKQNALLLTVAAVVVIAGMWLERYLLVMPTLQPDGAPPGVVELLVTAALGGALVCCVALFLGRYPGVSRADLLRTQVEHS